jgi:hypothetical protein
MPYITLQMGERWICQKDTCGAEIVVVKPSELEEGTQPDAP